MDSDAVHVHDHDEMCIDDHDDARVDDLAMMQVMRMTMVMKLAGPAAHGDTVRG